MSDNYEYQYTLDINPWRNFVSEMWFRHKDEVYKWTGKPVVDYDLKEYYHKNKWFLKQKFKKKDFDD